MRDDINVREITFGLFFAQPSKSLFEFGAGIICVDDDAISLFERRRIIFIYDIAVERDITGDLQPVTIRPEDAEIVIKYSDVVHDEDQRGVNLFDQLFRLKSRKDIAAFRVGRIDCQATISNYLA